MIVRFIYYFWNLLITVDLGILNLYNTVMTRRCPTRHWHMWLLSNVCVCVSVLLFLTIYCVTYLCSCELSMKSLETCHLFYVNVFLLLHEWEHNLCLLNYWSIFTFKWFIYTHTYVSSFRLCNVNFVLMCIMYSIKSVNFANLSSFICCCAHVITRMRG